MVYFCGNGHWSASKREGNNAKKCCFLQKRLVVYIGEKCRRLREAGLEWIDRSIETCFFSWKRARFFNKKTSYGTFCRKWELGICMAKRGRKQLKKDNIFSANTSNSIICEKCAYLERCGLECCMCECVNVWMWFLQCLRILQKIINVKQFLQKRLMINICKQNDFGVSTSKRGGEQCEKEKTLCF